MQLLHRNITFWTVPLSTLHFSALNCKQELWWRISHQIHFMIFPSKQIRHLFASNFDGEANFLAFLASGVSPVTQNDSTTKHRMNDKLFSCLWRCHFTNPEYTVCTVVYQKVPLGLKKHWTVKNQACSHSRYQVALVWRHQSICQSVENSVKYIYWSVATLKVF